MKAKKAFKRLKNIETLISEVLERSSASAPRIQELLREAKSGVIRAREAVQKSVATPKTPHKHASKAKPKPKPKRKLSAPGKKAVLAATKKRLAARRAEAKP